MADERREHLIRFHWLMDSLEKNIGGARTLAACSGRMDWPQKGVYFFREQGECRSDTGNGPRIVRVGTHALNPATDTKLWRRLAQHKGQVRTGGGNHRGSIFRLITGAALIGRKGLDYPTWGKGLTAKGDVKLRELALERDVSQVIGNMPFLWLAVKEGSGMGSRGYIERNSIALLSNYGTSPLDPPSQGWLGRHCNRERVRNSGLWNSNHVDERYDPAFLDHLYWLVAATGKAS